MNKITGKVVDGSEIRSARTLKSWYDNGNIVVGQYRMSADTVLQMVQYFYFDKEKARVHTYLTNPQCAFDEHGTVPKED